MKLLIKQRVFSWTDTYDVYDESGNVKYFVKAEFLSIGHRIHVYDTENQEVGMIKENYLCDGIAEYAKRLSRYCKLTFCQVADEKTPDKASEALNTQIKNTEGERLMKHIREQDYVIALAIDGKTPDSVELSQKIEKLGVSGISSIAFVIGGSLGLSESVLKRADYKLSFSRMTFPHQLMQMILLEQIYRSYRIMNHEPYHK